ncbi:Rne/Rng family ribonuclease [Amycolatopsis thermophila]|uniref:Ribonuclease E n=1 Tax=Amycolatopsis thermophila TaxID=206084 RepID=A0ABU0EMZ3_9PSEU|nr:Rne/Rng family ribonuclease [Amycolatopsis thermophila]MDQ0376401.1 ribonuclease E [Amycolatopsis thermophila]
MSNADTPAENTGGNTALPATGPLGELPPRVRVHALAKLLGSNSRVVLAKLTELGETARSAQSSVPREVAVKVAEALAPAEEQAAGEAAAPGAVAPAEDAARAPDTVPESTPEPVVETPAEPEAPVAQASTEQPATQAAATQAPATQARAGRKAAERATQAPAEQPATQARAGQKAPETPVENAAAQAPAGRKAAEPAAQASAEQAAARAAASQPAASETAGQAPADQPAARSKGEQQPAARAGRPSAKPELKAVPPTAEPEPAADPAAPPEPKRAVHMPVFAAPSPVFLPPEATAAEEPVRAKPAEEPQRDEDADDADGEDATGRRRRRRGRRGRGRGKGGDENATETTETDEAKPAEETARAEDEDTAEEAEPSDESDEGEGSSRRRRRRRRRKGSDGDNAENTNDDPPNTVVHVRETKAEEKSTSSSDGVRSVRGSTRLEAKRQRRRDGREAGRRRAPILSEAEFLARRESVERTMVVAERGEHTQIGVLEDGVLVEHFVTSQGSGSIVGNVYLGRVQNVLPSMEAAFVDIGRGRNAVLYAGEVDWDAAGLEGKSRKIEQALSTGDNVLVQVTKDPVGHKGARLTTQISLPGRFLVYMPSGGATGISRKLPENERRRLKDILKRIVPEDAGVIIRTASEGISEEELERDVRRLKAQWEVVKEKADSAAGGKKSSAPVMLYEEPDLLVKVIRDLFTEDFAKLEVQGDTAWETIRAYVEHVAPDLTPRLKRYVGTGDVLAEHRIDEQITKALDRKVWLPSGGYLVIDRTEAMTVIDVNTGKFTGSGGNLEETVTRNNLESAEEIVRQLRLRDIGGIIVIDFIDMVLESNRELVLKRLTECLGRDRTRHQVAEVTSLGLVQMTRKKIGTGLLEAFSTTCEHCKGRGVIVSTEPVKSGNGGGNGHQHGGGGGGSRRSRGRAKAEEQPAETPKSPEPSPVQRESTISAVEAMAKAAKIASTKTEGDEKHEAEADSGALDGAAPEAASPAETKAEAAAPAARSEGTAAADRSTAAAAVPAAQREGRTSSTQPEAAGQPAGGTPSGRAAAAEPAAGSPAAAAAPAGGTSSARPDTAARSQDAVPADNTAQAESAAQTGTGEQPAPEKSGAKPSRARRVARRPAAPPEPATSAEVAAPATSATEQAAKPAEQAAKPAEQAAKPAEQAAQPTEQTAQPAEQTAQPAEQPVEGAETSPEVDVPTPATRTTRRRPRRAASRPAGPPVHATDQS